MSPVPEPMQGGRGNPGNGDEEGITPPTGLTMGPPLSSSDEETDQVDSEDPNFSGYLPLPQDFDDDHDESAIDYNSLSGLMAALNTHGPNVIEDEAEENDNYNVEGNGESTQQVSGMSSQTVEYVEQNLRQSRQEESAEQASIWNSPQEDRLTLDGNKVEEIKSVMASFTLPQSAIPPWAQNISDEDWKNQIAGILSRKDSQ
ncbi:uncharacterized protein LOC135198541 [Macrobrachium nipponense]|uniref:uncharacterized protein LOC135198541 n=1 Tax=Macrobrachium nipponense TaxID=159736 RepID=UPI0030C8ADD1